MTICEARDATGITRQSRLFKAKSVLGKSVDGKKPRTYMPCITEETAQREGYSALVTGMDMILLLIEREACAIDEEADVSIRKMAENMDELEEEYKGCYIAVQGEPNRELMQWRVEVHRTVRGSYSGLDALERLITCAGSTSE